MSDLWNLPPEREGRPPDELLLEHRASIEKGIASRRALFEERAHIPRRDLTIAGVECIEVGEPDAPATLIYLHGGGFSLGHPRSWERYGALIADKANIRVILVRYRLATENPFPAGLRDVVSVFSALREVQQGKPIIVMGESAGASLTASLLAAAEASGQPYPDGAIIISPVMDFALPADTLDSHADVDPWVSRESLQKIGDNYLQGHPIEDPLASPIHADMASYPPIQLFCGGREGLLGDTLAFAGKLAVLNRNVEVHIVADAEHGWTFVKPDSSAAETTMTRVLRFIESIKEAARS
ncbi:MAG: alpha/beta hydrolase fold domain-containing protein [Novosphingobium sp.]|nr:alpha/beta hydrolase fold domain-containing protein [Novosphingobium sp.]